MGRCHMDGLPYSAVECGSVGIAWSYNKLRSLLRFIAI
jgi:hypothetical protein